MSSLVQNQYDMNYYDSQACLNLFRTNMINVSRLEMKTWRNTLKLSKWHKESLHWHWRWHWHWHWHWQSYSLDRFEQVERSKIQGWFAWILFIEHFEWIRVEVLAYHGAVLHISSFKRPSIDVFKSSKKAKTPAKIAQIIEYKRLQMVIGLRSCVLFLVGWI